MLTGNREFHMNVLHDTWVAMAKVPVIQTIPIYHHVNHATMNGIL